MKTKTLVALSAYVCFVLTASAQSISDYSVLPETMASAPDQTPNILFVIDSSGSMLDNESNTRVGAHDPTSRSYLVRRVLRELLTDNVGSLNAGLMTFGGSSASFAVRWNDGVAVNFRIENCNGYSFCASTARAWYTRNLTGKGYLLENVEPVTNAFNTELLQFLATEPQTPSFGLDNRYNIIDGDDYITNGGQYYLHNPNDNLLYNGTIISAGGTPLAGSLQSAKSYLIDKNLTAAEVAFDLADVESPIINSNIAAQCVPNTYVFLITDGLPTVKADGTGVSNGAAATQAEVNNVAAAATALYNSGVETWVFGYALPNGAATYMNQIANAGSNNTRPAFVSQDAATLKQQLDAAIQSVIRIGGSSSGISVIASSSDAAGSVIQAIFNPEITGQEDDPNSSDPADKIDVTVAWTSTLSAYFIDQYGYLREDSPTLGTQGKLDDYSIDKAFRLGFNNITQEVEVTRLSPTGLETASFNENPDPVKVPLSALNPVWEAGKILSSYDQTAIVNGTPVNIYSSINRPYDEVASETNGYRRIYSWVQTDPGNTAQLDVGKQIEFIYSDTSNIDTINPGNHTLLDTPSAAASKNVVNFIRGEEGITGFRNRSIDGKAYLLGDIVHSTAAQVDVPGENYGSRFNDSSYTNFRDHYKYRRRMVYVGANDGLLHAFNGGFWKGAETKYYLTATGIGCTENCDDVEHELGAEVWAYAPMNLLPHLKFLASPNYDSGSHISFLDGAVSVYDVKAFTPDDTHIGGWGTILVVGMRLGGGEYDDVDHDADGDASDAFTARSAYIVIDVTDPRDEPKVIAEITHPRLGFTVGQPDIMKEGDDWHLVFGSGPTDLKTATSDQRARLFRYKLNEGSRGFDSSYNGSNGQAFTSDDGFVGDVISHDWNSDFEDDVAYFGVLTGSELTGGGGMYRYVSNLEGGLAAGKVRQLLDTGTPVFQAPLAKSTSSQNWVYFGSGRYLTTKDAEENAQQNKFYGVREPIDSNTGLRTYGTVTAASLIDMSTVQVKTDGDLVNSPVPGVTVYSELRRHIITNSNVGGWQYDLPQPTGRPSAKNSSSPLSFKDILFQSYYLPPFADGDLCTNEFGSSFLRAVDSVTGVANFTPDFDGVLGNENDILTDTVLIGDGYAYDSYLFVGPDPETGKNHIIIKAPLSTGEIKDTEVEIPPGPNGRTSWREIQIQ